MSTHAVVFDLFGTLIPKWDTGRSTVTLTRMARHLDLSMEEFAEAWGETYWNRELGRTTLKQSVRCAMESIGATLSEGRIEDAYRMWAALIELSIKPRNSEVVETLREIRARGFKIGLISNCGPEVPSLVRESAFARFIDHATFSCEIGIAKPDPRIFEAHCRELGVKPEQSVFLGDGGSYELDGAQSVGMESIFLRIDEEIAAEGLPEGVAEWTGREMGRLEDILHHLDRM